MDTCAAEIGGWEDWMFHFDEAFGSLYLKSGTSDMSLYLTEEQAYNPVGKFEIEHQDWAYLRPLGAFIPRWYNVTIETAAGVLNSLPVQAVQL